MDTEVGSTDDDDDDDGGGERAGDNVSLDSKEPLSVTIGVDVCRQ
jgi:hypothetical protein